MLNCDLHDGHVELEMVDLFAEYKVLEVGEKVDFCSLSTIGLVF